MDLYKLFFHPGEVVELRALGLRGRNKAWDGSAGGKLGVVSGYFNDGQKLAAAAKLLDAAGARGVYYTANPCQEVLLSRAVNRLVCPAGEETTPDQYIQCVRWFLIDLDSLLLDGTRRPKGVSASKEEIEACEATAKAVSAWLEGEIGFAKGIRAFSGNGYHLLYRLEDLPNAGYPGSPGKETHELIVASMAALQAKFGKDVIDTTVVNPARIWKYYSTTGRKGDSTSARPHRKSYLFPKQVDQLDDISATSIEALRKMAALAPAAASSTAAPRTQGPQGSGAPVPATTPGSGSGRKASGEAKPFKKGELGPLDVERYLSHYGVQFTVKEKGNQILYVLERCLFNPDHGKGEASIIATPSGTSPLLYQCFHQSCQDRRWKDARQIISGDKPIAEFCAGYDPNWKPPATEGTGAMAAIAVKTETGIASEAAVDPPEKVDTLEFFEKRGKRPVFVPLYLANYLAAYLSPIVHTSGEFWRYRDGLWKPFPETTINQVIGTAMKERWQGDFQTNAVKRLKGLVNQEEDAWPKENHLIPCKNGMLDIDTMALLEHDSKYGNRHQLPVSYREKAWSQRWWDFQKEIFPDDTTAAKRFILQQFFGYCLLMDCRYQVALFMYGTGANGKSTTLDVLEAMLGRDNCSSMSLEELCERFATYFLQNKLVNLATETNSRNPMGTELLKKMISGDKVTCEAKYGQKFQFRPYAKFIAALNDPPVIPDKSYGFGRRILVLNFERRFLPEEIAARSLEIGGKMSDYLIEEIDGVFGWAVEGLQKLLKRAGFLIPDEVRKDTDDMMETLNPLLIFVNEMCEIHDGASVGTMEIWECYAEWCKEGKNRPLGRNRFLDQIQQTFPRVKKTEHEKDGSRQRAFKGIALTLQAQTWLLDRQERYRKRDDSRGRYPDGE